MAQIFCLSFTKQQMINMKKILLPACVLAMVSFSISCGDEHKDSTETAEQKNEATEKNAGTQKLEDDHEFAVDAASGGMMEVQLGQIAATNAASAKVKEFGQMMVDDHSKANDEMKALAATKGITLPATPGEKHQKHINDLKDKKAADFDKDYISMMVDDHEEDIKKFEEEANNGKDAELKAFAAGKLPILRKHLEMAKSIKDAMK
jgi:putative membrane protein